MSFSICCKELGIDCHFVAEGGNRAVVIDSLMRHVQTEHTDEWFDLEEFYQIACSVINKKTD